MKKLTTILAILMLGSFLVVGSSFADAFNLNRPYTDLPLLTGWTPPVAWTEDRLQDVFDNYLGAGVLDDVDDQSNVAVWQHAEVDTAAYSIAMIGGDSGVLGLYDFNDAGNTYEFDFTTGSNTFEILNDGELLINNSSTDTGWSESFGFYWRNTSVALTSFTEDSKNTGGYGDDDNILALTYLIEDGLEFTLGNRTINTSGDNDWILAFEDRANGDEWGDGDFNDAVFYMEDMKPVPEPATMLLLGTGLIGLAAIGRKKFLK